ncbi:hypothetical protein BDZ97DRAFT_1754408 [Flammula alnicola]|nr:hypothetical protein BDZ97DRAFT_1754408 [Flammula alnicola]
MTINGVSRTVLIDDTDSSISYTGQWFQDQNTESFNSPGTSGPPFLGTLHGPNSNGSLAYTFIGSSSGVAVVGTIELVNRTSDGSSISPPWKCIIDSTSVYAIPPSSTRVRIYDTVTVHVAVPLGQSFWFDYIEYAPSVYVGLEQELVSVNSENPKLRYDSGWHLSQELDNVTSENGSTLVFSFNVTSLLNYLGQAPPSVATYSVDGQTPIGFQLDGISILGNPKSNQQYFQTAQLPARQDTLEVVLPPGSSGISSPTSTSIVAGRQPSFAANSGNLNGNSISTGKIPGIVVGVVVDFFWSLLLSATSRFGVSVGARSSAFYSLQKHPSHIDVISRPVLL